MTMYEWHHHDLRSEVKEEGISFIKKARVKARDGSEIKSIYYSCRGPGFASQHPCVVTHTTYQGI